MAVVVVSLAEVESDWFKSLEYSGTNFSTSITAFEVQVRKHSEPVHERVIM